MTPDRLAVLQELHLVLGVLLWSACDSSEWETQLRECCRQIGRVSEEPETGADECR